METALRIHQLNKHFANGRHALRDINLSVQRGEMVALIGASGSGKSTLLRHVAGLVTADGDGGESLIEIDGRCVQQRGRIHRDIRKVRAQVGFVFQQFNLVARLPVLVNVLVGSLHRMPWWRSWTRSFTARERALALDALSRVGIADCHAQRASTLSGGQQQRAAIARTLVQGAKVVLADEPIASLDPESSRKVMEILARINREDRSHRDRLAAPGRDRDEVLPARDRAEAGRSGLRRSLFRAHRAAPARALRRAGRRAARARPRRRAQRPRAAAARAGCRGQRRPDFRSFFLPTWNHHDQETVCGPGHRPAA